MKSLIESINNCVEIIGRDSEAGMSLIEGYIAEHPELVNVVANIFDESTDDYVKEFLALILMDHLPPHKYIRYLKETHKYEMDHLASDDEKFEEIVRQVFSE